MTKTILIAALMSILAQAQTTPQQFNGIHYASNSCGPYGVEGENGCEYVGNIATDPYSAYATLSDNTGLAPVVINPRGTPPTINESGSWSGSMNWQNGGELSGTVTIATGTCYGTGGVTGPYQAIYTVTCSGVDTVGNAASKSIKYVSNKLGGRGGAFWQPLTPYSAYNQPSQWPQLAFYVPYPTAAAISGTDDGH